MRRGLRPFVNDEVTILSGPRAGEVGTVVQDDRDSQPYLLRYADGTTSNIFYRPTQVCYCLLLSVTVCYCLLLTAPPPISSTGRPRWRPPTYSALYIVPYTHVYLLY